MSNDISNKILAIAQKFNKDKKIQLDFETDLFSAGVLDSFGMVEYLVTLEKEFNIKISNDDLIPQNLWNVSASAETVKKYLK